MSRLKERKYLSKPKTHDVDKMRVHNYYGSARDSNLLEVTKNAGSFSSYQFGPHQFDAPCFCITALATKL